MRAATLDAEEERADAAAPQPLAVPDRLAYEDVRFERAPCPLCAADAPSAPVLTGRDDVWQKRGEFHIVRCGQCGLAYTCPRPTPDTMRYYYEDCYAGRSEQEMRKAALDSPFSRFLTWMRARTIERQRPFKAGDVVIDVGCSYGAFIEAVRKARGVEAWAIDLDPETVAKFVNPVDVRVRTGDLRDQAFEEGTFDVVTLFETLEHVYDPVALLGEVRRILKPGGIVSVEVPNWASPTRRLFGSCWLPLLLPTHLQHFTPDRLRECAQRAGLEVVHHQTMFFPAEVTLSTGIVFTRLLGRPAPEQRTLLRKVFDGLLALWLLGVFLCVDVPLLALLSLIGKAGHQTLIARRPEETGSV